MKHTFKVTFEQYVFNATVVHSERSYEWKIDIPTTLSKDVQDCIYMYLYDYDGDVTAKHITITMDDLHQYKEYL